MKGTEEQFQSLAFELHNLTKKYENHAIKHAQYTEGVDDLFHRRGWSKKEFYKEMDIKLGINRNIHSKNDRKQTDLNKKSLPKA